MSRVPQKEAELRGLAVGVQAVSAGVRGIGLGELGAEQKLRRLEHSRETHLEPVVEALEDRARRVRNRDRLAQLVLRQRTTIKNGSGPREELRGARIIGRGIEGRRARHQRAAMRTPRDLLSDAVCHGVELLHTGGRDTDPPGSQREQTLLAQPWLEASLDLDRR